MGRAVPLKIINEETTMNKRKKGKNLIVLILILLLLLGLFGGLISSLRKTETFYPVVKIQLNEENIVF